MYADCNAKRCAQRWLAGVPRDGGGPHSPPGASGRNRMRSTMLSPSLSYWVQSTEPSIFANASRKPCCIASTALSEKSPLQLVDPNGFSFWHCVLVPPAYLTSLLSSVTAPYVSPWTSTQCQKENPFGSTN